jgi:hypothetical protein
LAAFGEVESMGTSMRITERLPLRNVRFSALPCGQENLARPPNHPISPNVAKSQEVVTRFDRSLFAGRYNYALQSLQELPYNRWREYDPEDAVRFYALHLQEVGMIKSSPQKIIAQGTDWRFLTELKKELKG